MVYFSTLFEVFLESKKKAAFAAFFFGVLHPSADERLDRTPFRLRLSIRKIRRPAESSAARNPPGRRGFDRGGLVALAALGLGFR